MAEAPAVRRVPLLVRLIALGKAGKCILFLVAAVLTARLANAPDIADEVAGALRWFHFDPDGERAQRLIAWATGIPLSRLHLVAAGMSLWGGIYLVEAVGLWFDRPWAEWLVVVATAMFIPFELHHLVVKPGVGIVIALLINIAAAWYLAARIRGRRRAQRDQRGSEPASRMPSAR